MELGRWIKKLRVWISRQHVIKPFLVMLELSRFALVIGQAQDDQTLPASSTARSFLPCVGFSLLRDAQKSHADARPPLMGFIHKGGHLVVRDARLFLQRAQSPRQAGWRIYVRRRGISVHWSWWPAPYRPTADPSFPA